MVGAAITAGGCGALPRHGHAVVVVTHSRFGLVCSGVVVAAACACRRRRFGGCRRDRMGGCAAATPREDVARARGRRRRHGEEQRRFRQWCHGRPLCFAGSLPPPPDAPRLPIGRPSSQVIGMGLPALAGAAIFYAEADIAFTGKRTERSARARTAEENGPNHPGFFRSSALSVPRSKARRRLGGGVRVRNRCRWDP